MVKKQKKVILPYTLYYPHTLPISNRLWKQPYIQFCSIDPALKNLAIRIERRYDDNLIVCLHTDNICPWLLKSIHDGYHEVEINLIYNNINTYLDNLMALLLDCHYILIERQLYQNFNVDRIGQHIRSYFLIKLTNAPLCPSILEIDPKLKGRQLGAGKLPKYELKKWSIQKATELSQQRGDIYTLNLLKKHKKKDDLADVLCQIEAFCSYQNLPVTKPITGQVVKFSNIILYTQ